MRMIADLFHGMTNFQIGAFTIIFVCLILCVTMATLDWPKSRRRKENVPIGGVWYNDDQLRVAIQQRDEVRAQRDASRVKVMALEARIAELERETGRSVNAVMEGEPIDEARTEGRPPEGDKEARASAFVDNALRAYVELCEERAKENAETIDNLRVDRDGAIATLDAIAAAEKKRLDRERRAAKENPDLAVAWRRAVRKRDTLESVARRKRSRKLNRKKG